MAKFPKDARKADVLHAMQELGFYIVREREHIYLERKTQEGRKIPMVIPNHPRIKASTLRSILMQSKISRDDFLNAFESR
jgi:predicted RNA binding protein YcfA (HicA-like mRNA interferase family)